ncbi:MAG: ketoacyl-ACP synthase III [Calditrichaeota bacterium]|nr:MAG: ketoacyl-ACP synthase III [Calditrichota bacterium]MBL1204703.1 ketoacyl-ACP synthase III [Calditrichota bacterium]NOG44531.1 ketoacyl-ACP synthase III [Calditrichota bacterium]
MKNSKIIGLGKYIPKRTVTNADLEKIMETSDSWIQERTGIKERHYAKPGKETVSWMGAEAAKQALKMAGLQASEIDFIIFATLSPDFDFPGSGCPMQVHLGIPGIGALDVRNQCSGFVYSMAIADQFIKTGMYKNILVVGAEVQSTGLNMTTEGRDVAVIFGDGAGAAILTSTEEKGKGILSSNMHADGTFARELFLEDPGSSKPKRISKEMIDEGGVYPYMNGRYVFKHAVQKFPAAINEALNDAGCTLDDVDLVIPHQANKRITEAIQMRLEIPKEKVFSNIEKYGNTTAASIPIALTEAYEEGLIKDGSLVCLAAFGSGFTWGANLIRF